MNSFRGSLRIAATQDVVDAEFVVDEQQLEVKTGGEKLGSWELTDLTPDDTGTHVLLNLDGEQVIIDVPQHGAFVAALSPSGKKRRRRARKQKPAAKHRADRPKSRRKKEAKGRSRPEPKPKREPETEPVPQVQVEPEPESAAEPEPAPSQHKQPPARTKALPRPSRREPRDVLGAVRSLLDRDRWREWLSDRVVRWVIASFAVMGFAALALFATNSLGMILILLGMVALIVAALAVSDDLTAYSWIPGNLSETTLIIAGVIAMAIGGLLILIG